MSAWGPTSEGGFSSPSRSLFCLFPSLLCSMYKHPMEDNRVMGTSCLPSHASVQKYVDIHMVFYLPNGPTLCICSLLGSEGFVLFVSMPQFQQSMVTKRNMEILLYLQSTTQPMWCKHTRLLAIHKTKLPTRYNFTSFLLHNSLPKYITPRSR